MLCVMQMSRSKTFLISCIFFIVGIAIASWLPIKIVECDIWWFSGMMVGLVVLCLFFKNKRIMVMTLFGVFLFLGMWRYSLSLPTDTPNKIWHYNGEIVTVQGVIIKEPDVRERNQKLEVSVKYLTPQPPLLDRRWGENLKVSGKILVTTNLYPNYEYGDEIEFTCELQAPEEFSGFAYDRYLSRYDIYSVCYYPKNLIRLNSAPFSFIGSILKIKNKLKETINYGLPANEAGLAQAITLGYKSNISQNLRDNFSKAGLSHIAAISGLHISILAGLLFMACLGLGLPRRGAFYAATLFLIGYIIIIGSPASAMRAGLMGFLVLWAMNLGRLSHLVNSLFLAGVILLLFNPKLLRDDIGFQLSFLAVLGITYVFPILDKLTNNFKGIVKNIFNIFNITMAAQVFTLPIIALNFGQVSLIAPVANLLALWVLPILLVAVLAGLFLSLIFSSLSILFFLPAYIMLKYIIVVADWTVKVPLAYVEIDYLWWGWMAIYYLVVVWAIARLRKN